MEFAARIIWSPRPNLLGSWEAADHPMNANRQRSGSLPNP
jgi:hypothetical protein